MNQEADSPAENNQTAPINFDNSYIDLPEQFYQHQLPSPVSAPSLIRTNSSLAKELGISADWLKSDAGIEMTAGNTMPSGAEPIATVYAGHQFGSWNPQLGDGRAVLLGEVVAANGTRFDLQLKGSGPTPYSRGGDGRAPLGPVLREYIVSEAMAALDIPSTRSLMAVTTGDPVFRDEPLPGAVLLRVAQSHIRIGTFQFFAARRDHDALQQLADHVINRHYVHALTKDNPIVALLDAVILGQARLIAKWQLVGFIHGVMNTDNMLLSGETIDYGPCSFMDAFNPDMVLSSIDVGGRYAYSRQPGIAHWNLINLAQALLPIIDKNEETAIALAQESINTFPDLYREAYEQGLFKKLGISSRDDEDSSLVEDLFALMATEQVDFTQTFRHLGELANPAGNHDDTAFQLSASFSNWLTRWRTQLDREANDPASLEASMNAVNPVYIPRNHLIEEVIEAAVVTSDLEPFHQLMDVVVNPYEHNPGLFRYALPPSAEQIVRQTFCGT
jgi:uncharacterized protein YdiU (UPF0061 family)